MRKLEPTRMGLNAFEWNEFRNMLSVGNKMQLEIMKEMIELNLATRELNEREQ